VKGGGADNSNNQGSAPSTSFPPSDLATAQGWIRPSNYGYRLNSACETDGLCFNGDLPELAFGTLPHPDGSPPPDPNDRFGIMSTADFICKAGFSNCQEGDGAVDVPITVTSTAVHTPVFTVPAVGDYVLEFRWALLSNDDDVGLNNFGRIQLFDVGQNSTSSLVGLTTGDIGDPGKPAARTGGCGHQVIGNDPTGSYDEVYDLCTDWQSFSTSLAALAGHSLQLQFEVTEVGDNVATTLAFEDVELIAVPTAAEGAVEQVVAPPLGPLGTYAWSIQAGCVVNPGTATLQTVSFDCADNGLFELYLVKTTEFGQASTDTGEVTITNVAPTVNAITLPAQIAQNTPFTATATFSDPGSGDTHSGVWDWGDATTSPATQSGGAFSNSHTYTQAGNFTIKLTVTDDDGEAGTAQTTASVRPAVLAASIDIRPATSTNVINLKLLPIIPVALWGRAGFDVTKVAVSSLRFGPGAAPPLLGALRFDLNHDGHKDLLASFGTKRSGIQVGQTSACLSGTIAGRQFQGCDAIRVVAGP
jgi:PKD repeat protein